MPGTRSSTSTKKQAALSEAQWVKAESIKQVMQSVIRTQFLTFCAMCGMFFLLYNQTLKPALFAWFGVNSLLSLIRLWLLRGYNQSALDKDIKKRHEYFLRYAKLAPLNGLLWGISIFLFNGYGSPNIDIFCLIVVLVFGMLSVSNLSSHLRLLNHFIAAYGLGLLTAILLRVVFVQKLQPDTMQIWFLVMTFILVVMMFRIGKRMNTTYSEALAFRFQNKQLIASLTEQREAALAAVATKNRMLASAAHDMRQPVLALNMYAGCLMDDPVSSHEIAPKIAASTKAVINLFDSLFDMSRLTEGQVSTNLAPVNLDSLVYDLFVQYQPIAAAKGLELRTRTIDGDIFTDALLLERILGNLISNAIKYTNSGGILLACRLNSKGVQLEVWDTGVGISPDQQNLVFKEFYKSPSNVGTTDGFGLGLAIVTQLSELLGAEIKLRSRRGLGTVVTLQFGKLI